MKNLMRHHNTEEQRELTEEEKIAHTLEMTKVSIEKMIADKRKSGYDTYVAELLFSQVPTQIAYAKVSDNPREFHICKAMFIDIINELSHANKIDIREELS